METIEKVFNSFSADLLIELERNAVYKTFEQDEVLMKTGQYIKSTILVLNGKIKIYREDENGNEFFMYFLSPGQACAISMICAAKMEASQVMAKVVEKSDVVMIPIQLMNKLMANHKSWYEFVIETYKTRFEEILEVVDQIAFSNMDERLESYLKRIVKNNQSNIITTSHQEIANDINTSREVVSRLLKKMEQKKWLILNRNCIEITLLPYL